MLLFFVKWSFKLLLMLLLPLELVCEEPPVLPANSRLGSNFEQPQTRQQQLADYRQHQRGHQIPSEPQRPLPDDVGLSGESNFALLDPPETEFHVWRAPFPSVGQAWPKPTKQTGCSRTGEHLSLALPDFQFVLESPAKSSNIDYLLRQAFQRYRTVIVDWRAVSVAAGRLAAASSGGRGQISELKIRLKLRSSIDSEDAPLLPGLDMDESYSLHISRSNALLTAREPWGVLRGLETFSQLVWQTEDGSLFVNCTEIFDKPRFKHRGLLVDTSRHYIAVDTLKKNLDAMEMNKLNVFHWHIVDDQSFPYQSVVFPKLSEKGAYDSSKVYSLTDIREIIEYARLRGIRVVPEFDTPGHTHSWSLGYPDIFTKCYSYSRHWTGFYGPMNPALNATYDFLKVLYSEIVSLFKDSYIHLGADEVGTSCWDSNPEVNRMRADFGFTRSDQLIDYFFRRLQNIVTSLGSDKPDKKRGFIVWQEAYDHGVMLKKGSIVQVWKGEAPDVAMVAQAGYRTLYSTCWYLDRLEYGPQWTKLYLCDPVAGYGNNLGGGAFQQPQQQQAPQRADPPTPSWLSNVLGGEACMWNEYQDDSTVLQRIWPLASAVAERLWSQPAATRDLLAAGRRIEEQRCRMQARGVPVGVASGPGSCPRTLRKRHRLNDSKLIHSKKKRKNSGQDLASSIRTDASVANDKKPWQPAPIATSEEVENEAPNDDVSIRRVLVQQVQHRPLVNQIRHFNQRRQNQQHPLVLFVALVFAALALFLVLSRAVFVLRMTRYGSASETASGQTDGKSNSAASMLWPWLRPRRLLLCLAVAAACNVLVWMWTTLF